jgi:nitroimidazol reductase NimA-like FMN-containing flavoprotein (pyridoxamine 5'-phosphate oxidase superfamily)
MADRGDVVSTQPASDRVRLRRKRERGQYDRQVVDAILDEALIAHLGIADAEGQPFVIPMLHAR